MDQKVRESWEDFLNPDELRHRLIRASLYIAAYELLQDTVVDRIKSFFISGFNENGDIIDPKYQEVLGRSRSRLYASLLWHQDLNAIEKGDLEAFERIKKCRNELAHELISFVGGAGINSDVDKCFHELAALLRKIEVWWIREFEMTISPDFDGVEVDDDEILPGPIMALDLMHRIALGRDEDASRFYREFVRKTRRMEDKADA